MDSWDDDGPDASVTTVVLVIGWWVTFSLIIAYVPYAHRVSVWRWGHALLFMGVLMVAPSPHLTTLIGLATVLGLSWVIGSEVLKATDK